MSHPVKSPKKLIEVALPLDAINVAAAKEKSIRHGHPSTLHLWWARRPLAAARAVIFSQMVNDPSWKWEMEHPGEIPPNNLKASWAASRKRLFKIIEDLVLWENTTNEMVLERARAEIRKSWVEVCELNKEHSNAAELFNPDKLPAFHDPFAGGGALPLEAQRLGLESYASDLNPVAVLINKAMIEIPPKFAGMKPVGARASRPHKGWHSRSYLPHWDNPGLVQAITFRLADALPAHVVEKLMSNGANDPEKRRRLEAYLDAGHGECLLGNPKAAKIVEKALLHFDNARYRLLAWCVMPNHVHVMIETWEGFPLADLLHSWKSYTAKELNKLFGTTGKVWQEEYFDRFIRDERHFHAAFDYIHRNPVAAGLVKRAEDWEWSGARAIDDLAGIVDSAGGYAGGTPALPGVEVWSGAKGLAEDVRFYGAWMREEAFKRIGHLYPRVQLPKEYGSGEATVIAWLWARTVKSPNPAFSHVEVPLVSTFILSSKDGKEAYIDPVIEGDRYRFEVKSGVPPDGVKGGTTAGKRNAFLCLLSGTPMDYSYIRAEGKAGRMGQKLMAIVAEGARGRVYLAPTMEMETIAAQAKPEWKPETKLPDNTRDFKTPNYGMDGFGDLFTPRQLVALTTFSDLVQEAREKIKGDAEQSFSRGVEGTAGKTSKDLFLSASSAPPPENMSLDAGGTGAIAYADAVSVYLGLGIDKLTDYNSTLVSWSQSRDQAAHVFTKQALPMVWDFCEVNIFAGAAGDIEVSLSGIARSLANLPATAKGSSVQMDAQGQEISTTKVISTDPPYYDNIGYADLSDFFYVWLRRALRLIYPDLFTTIAVPKAEELVATPYRHGSKEKAETFFINGMTKAMHRLAEQAHPAFPTTIYYAFKQSETNETGTGNTGWETFLDAVLQAGFALTGTWPMRTERGARSIGIGANTLASSIILVCRKRDSNAATISRREYIRELNAVLPEALDEMTKGSGDDVSPVAPVDLSQSIIGPGMAVFSKYATVLEADGSTMTVHTALQLINRFLAEDDFDADTRFCLHWFEQYGWGVGPFGNAETLSRAKGTSVTGVANAGVVESGGGTVRLFKWSEYPTDWDPTTDDRNPIWETLHHLIRTLRQDGETKAGKLLADVKNQGESVRQLAYRLYTLCERQGWAEDARAYNELITSWTGIESAASEAPSIMKQGDLFS